MTDSPPLPVQPVDGLLAEADELIRKVAQGGPHEWGYRDPIDGGFIVSNWPFEAADVLPRLSMELREQRRTFEARLRNIRGRAALGGLTLPADIHRLVDEALNLLGIQP